MAKNIYRHWRNYFGNILSLMRISKNLSKMELAKRIETSDCTISGWERGVIPVIPAIGRLCKELDFCFIITKYGSTVLRGEDAKKADVISKKQIISFDTGEPLDFADSVM